MGINASCEEDLTFEEYKAIRTPEAFAGLCGIAVKQEQDWNMSIMGYRFVNYGLGHISTHVTAGRLSLVQMGSDASFVDNLGYR